MCVCVSVCVERYVVRDVCLREPMCVCESVCVCVYRALCSVCLCVCVCVERYVVRDVVCVCVWCSLQGF